jgi:hypothetical protein
MQWTAPTTGIAMCQSAVAVVERRESPLGRLLPATIRIPSTLDRPLLRLRAVGQLIEFRQAETDPKAPLSLGRGRTGTFRVRKLLIFRFTVATCVRFLAGKNQ